MPFAGDEFEQLVATRGCQLLRPDRRDESARHGSLGGVRQSIESIIHSGNNKLSIERHGARTLPGLIARIAHACSPSSPSAGNWLQGTPGRHFTAFGH